MSESADNSPRRVPPPKRLAQEQFAMAFLLGLVSRSLAICVVAAALYLVYLNWQ